MQVRSLGREDPLEKEISTPEFLPGGFPGGSVVKSPPANAGDAGSIPGSGRFPGGGNGKVLKLFQCSCWDNPMDRGAGKARVPEVAKSRT